MPCWTAIGTATRPTIATSGQRRACRPARPAAPARAPGRAAACARSTRLAVRRSSTVARSSPRPPVRRASSSYAVLALPLGLGLLVGGDQVGVARARWPAARSCVPVRDHPAVLEVDDLVGQRDRGPPVGDHQDRRACVADRAARPGCAASTRGSTALVASSSTSSRGRPASARASVSRCRCPPDSEVPRSPTAVSSPSGSRADEAVGLGQPQRRPDAGRRRRRRGRARRCRARCRRRRTAPAAPAPTVAGQRRRRSARARRRRRASTRAGVPGRPAARRAPAIVDLPEPVGPTSATVRPAGTVEGDVVQHRPGRRRSANVDPVEAQRGRPAVGVGQVGVAVRHLAGRRSSTCCTRSQPTTLRGSSASTQPIARTGKASTVNRNATLTSSVDARSRPAAAAQRADHQHGERAEAGQRVHQRVEQAAQPADRGSARRAARRPARANRRGLVRPRGPSS